MIFILDPAGTCDPVRNPGQEKNWFCTAFEVPYGAGTIVVIKVEAEDCNGHITSKSVILYSDVWGPQITITTPPPGPKTYYSSIPGVFSPQLVEGSILLIDVPDVNQMLYKVQAPSSGFSSSNIELTPLGNYLNPDGSFDFYLNDPSVSLVGKTGDVTVTVIARNTYNYESRPAFKLYEDSWTPTISGVSITSSNPNSSYAKVGDTVTLDYRVEDADSGVKGTPAVTISSNPPDSVDASSAPGMFKSPRPNYPRCRISTMPQPVIPSLSAPAFQRPTPCDQTTRRGRSVSASPLPTQPATTVSP